MKYNVKRDANKREKEQAEALGMTRCAGSGAWKHKGDIRDDVVLIDSKYTYKYDDKGNEIEILCQNFKGSIYSKTTYKYDDEGNKIEEALYEPYNFPEPSVMYKYIYTK